MYIYVITTDQIFDSCIMSVCPFTSMSVYPSILPSIFCPSICFSVWQINQLTKAIYTRERKAEKNDRKNRVAHRFMKITQKQCIKAKQYFFLLIYYHVDPYVVLVDSINLDCSVKKLKNDFCIDLVFLGLKMACK